MGPFFLATADGRNPKQPLGMVKDGIFTAVPSTGERRISEPSTVWLGK